MKRRVTKFDEIAELVLDEYELLEPSICFIRHSDNVTYKVTTRNAEAFLLRIHVPITPAMGIHGVDYGMVNSEVSLPGFFYGWQIWLFYCTLPPRKITVTDRNGYVPVSNN